MKSLNLTYENRAFGKMLKAKNSYGKINWERFIYIMIMREDVASKILKQKREYVQTKNKKV